MRLLSISKIEELVLKDTFSNESKKKTKPLVDPKVIFGFYKKYREIEKKLELAVTKNFSWQFVKISIIRYLVSDFEKVEILIFIKVCIMCVGCKRIMRSSNRIYELE
jgi:hypothetical protein